jgi:exodeoxyribonuclease V alpha subunit
MISISGVIERITYYSPENGYTVLRLRPDHPKAKEIAGLSLEGLITVVGNLPELSPGEHIRLEGDYFTHSKHGLQYKAEICEQMLPVTVSGIERYLGSGLIKGIGPGLAKRIVSHFKKNTLEVIEENPNRLKDVPGIGPDRTEKIVQAWEEQKQVKEIMLFLHSHKISTNLAVKIYKAYGDQSLVVIKKNPYQLEQDIYGIGFKTADHIAQNMGLPTDHPSRIEAGLIYALNEMINKGHVYTPEGALEKRAVELLEVNKDMIKPALSRLSSVDRIREEGVSDHLKQDRHLGVSEPEVNYGESLIYLTPFYHGEIGVAARIGALVNHPVKPKQGSLFLESEELSSEQIQALEMAIKHPMSVLTGGPGTGKTTCLKALINVLETQQSKYALASPTGRAAKRLSEATERHASTIHRLLGYSPATGFQYHEKNPLNIDFLVVDEASMLDLLLAYHLLRALKSGTQVLFVGDVDQLPSVGAGDVLRDVIASGEVPVRRLTTIYRQAENSQIVQNAHRINRGQMPAFSKTADGDFFLFPAEDAEKAAEWIVDLVHKRIPEHFGLDPIKDIQVLSPMYRGAAGVDALNELLQERLNPPQHNKHEQKLFGRIYREGDKVMQIRNNYDKDVYNGDIGLITAINPIEQELSILIDGVNHASYDFSEADELVLAYAVSVHKSQGSEFPAVVMPVLTQHYVMLQRNLIYTGITRAEKLCVLVGNRKALHIAINNNQVAKRYSRLGERIMESSSSSY